MIYTKVDSVSARIFLSDLKRKILSGLASFRSYPQRLSARGFEFYPLLSEQSFKSDFRFYLVSRARCFQEIFDFISNLGVVSEKGFGDLSPTQCDNDGRSLSLSLLSIATTTKTEKYAQFLKTV